MPEQLSLFPDDIPRAPPTRPGRGNHAVFFTIRPPASFAAQLVTTMAEARRLGVTAPLGNIATRHISLCCIGFAQSLGDADREHARAVANTIDLPPLPLLFDRLASFRARPGQRRPLVLLPIDQAPLATLAAALRPALPGSRRPPAALFHLTLCYDVADIGTQPVARIGFTADRFELVESVHGESRYVPLGAWPLH